MASDINLLIKKGESGNLEFKETLFLNLHTRKEDSNIVNASLKAVAAFLNTNGGTLLIGVSDKGEINGIELDHPFCKKGKQNNDGFELKFRDILNAHLKPYPHDKITLQFEKSPAGTICRVDVLPSPTEIHLDNDLYVRDGNRNLKLEGPGLVNWIKLRTTNTSRQLTATQKEKLVNIGETIVDALREIVSKAKVENLQLTRLRNAIKDNGILLGRISEYLEGILKTVTILASLDQDDKNRAMNAFQISQLMGNLIDEIPAVKKKFLEMLNEF